MQRNKLLAQLDVAYTSTLCILNVPQISLTHGNITILLVVGHYDENNFVCRMLPAILKIGPIFS